MADRPAVFVSSTCYDLNQIREDLKEFILKHGFIPLLSEHRSFPVDPDLSTVENCRRVVCEAADLFVLVVGASYGTVLASGQSITNVEYREAVRKGIPIHAFVQKGVLNIQPVWRQNPGGDYSSVVDSPRLFEFVDALHGSGERWVFPFETAEDIKMTLREQWPRLFKDGLDLRLRFRRAELPQALSVLTGTALRVVVERPDGWEFTLLGTLIAEEKSLTADLKRDYDLGLEHGDWQMVSGREALSCLRSQLN